MHKTVFEAHITRSKGNSRIHEVHYAETQREVIEYLERQPNGGTYINRLHNFQMQVKPTHEG